MHLTYYTSLAPWILYFVAVLTKERDRILGIDSCCEYFT